MHFSNRWMLIFFRPPMITNPKGHSESDYNCLYDVNPDDLKEKLEPAKQLLDIIETMI